MSEAKRACWKVVRESDKQGFRGLGIQDEQGRFIANLVFQIDDSELSNARLMAAAPELLESLQDTVRILKAVRHTVGLGQTQLERIERADAAIAKAEAKPTNLTAS